MGRTDGARASDFYQLLEERAGLGRDATSYVRVRQRNTFVGIRREHLTKTIEALNGASIAGKEAVAEQARPRE